MIQISQFIQSFPASINQQDKEPWEITKTILEIINGLIPSLSKDFNINDGIAIHKTAAIESGVTIKPPVIIGEGCFIGAHAGSSRLHDAAPGGRARATAAGHRAGNRGTRQRDHP